MTSDGTHRCQLWDANGLVCIQEIVLPVAMAYMSFTSDANVLAGVVQHQGIALYDFRTRLLEPIADGSPEHAFTGLAVGKCCDHTAHVTLTDLAHAVPRPAPPDLPDLGSLAL